MVGTLDKVTNGLKDASELLDMAVAENEPSAVADVERDIAAMDEYV